MSVGLSSRALQAPLFAPIRVNICVASAIISAVSALFGRISRCGIHAGVFTLGVGTRKKASVQQSETEQQPQPVAIADDVRRVSAALLRRPPVRLAAALVGLLLLLLVAQHLLLNLTAEPLRLTISPTRGTLTIDGQTLTLPLRQRPTVILFAAPDPLTREFQIDGTDSTNNFSLDPAYITRIVGAPYYRFQMWMRDSSSYSAWRDVRTSGATVTAQPDGSALVTLARNDTVTSIDAALLRPETPTHIYLRCGDETCGEIIVNRNDRYILAHALASDGAVSDEQRIYFPESPLPFLAEVLYLVAQVALWSLALLLVALALYSGLALYTRALPMDLSHTGVAAVRRRAESASRRLAARLTARLAARLPGWVVTLGRRGDHWDRLALLTLAASLGYVLWVALAQYQGQPHILDASAYLFQAKIFATGHLSAPVPSDLGAFQGPFMVARDGRWFSMFPPMTSLLLAVGIVLRVPWLVEPLLGTLALWGVYRIGRSFYSGAVSWLAVLLASLSPFYTYLAASYMSHTMALFFTVYFVWALVRFTRDWRWYDLPLAAVCIIGLLLTRELSAAVVGVGASAFLVGSQWRAFWRRLGYLWPAFVLAGSILLSGVMIYLLYNDLQTGSALVSPREAFFPADRYGFGQGIGFYGQHTFAAGMVILDQLLTSLLIDLYGWPFYLTLALLALTFLRRDASTRWDAFCALLLILLTGAQAGYFYHGIYLGPRHLFEALPFLLLLTARGVTGLAIALTRMARSLGAARPSGTPAQLALVVSGLLLALLLACNVFYYSPRQTQIYASYTGLPASMKVDAQAFYAFHPQQAIVITNNWFIYNYMLWPLNDPALSGPTLYAYAPTADTITRLRAQYPNRALYLAQVAPNGAVTFAHV
jgi:Dolichyl-phosphate-mannose-protein mannosyltransferase